jgi:hypothetical protein
MTAAARQLLHEVAGLGGTVHLDGGNLRLATPEPLPDALRVRLREHKAEIVRLLDEPTVMQSDRPPPPSFAAIFDEFGLDPLLDQDREEATRVWLGLPARGPPA